MNVKNSVWLQLKDQDSLIRAYLHALRITEMKKLLRLHIIYLAPQVHVVSLQIHLLKIKFMPHVSNSKLNYQGNKRTSVQRIAEFH